MGVHELNKNVSVDQLYLVSAFPMSPSRGSNFYLHAFILSLYETPVVVINDLNYDIGTDNTGESLESSVGDFYVS